MFICICLLYMQLYFCLFLFLAKFLPHFEFAQMQKSSRFAVTNSLFLIQPVVKSTRAKGSKLKQRREIS